MRIYVDHMLCSGNGICEEIADDIFRVDESRAVHILNCIPGEDRREEVQDAVDACPTQALSIEG